MFYRENEEYVSPQYRRYAHKECAKNFNNIHNLAKRVLKEYYIEQRVNKNIKDFVTNGMTLKEIYDVAYYWYCVQTLEPVFPEKSQGGFGIVPYVLPKYQKYKAAEEMKKKINKGKHIKDYVNKESKKIIFEVPPIKKPRGLNFFILK
jgi:hypothetical protein